MWAKSPAIPWAEEGMWPVVLFAQDLHGLRQSLERHISTSLRLLERMDVFGKKGCAWKGGMRLERSDEAQARGEHPAVLPAVQSCLLTARSPVWGRKKSVWHPKESSPVLLTRWHQQTRQCLQPWGWLWPPRQGSQPPRPAWGSSRGPQGSRWLGGAAGSRHGPAPSRRVS